MKHYFFFFLFFSFFYVCWVPDMQMMIWLMYINVCYVMPYLTTMLGTPYPRSTRRGQVVACTMLHSTELPSNCILWWINAVTKLLHPYPSDIRWCHMHASIIGDRRFVIRCTRQCVVAVNECKLCSRVSPGTLQDGGTQSMESVCLHLRIKTLSGG